MIEEQELRNRLWAADVPPSRLDVETLVNAGRRRVMRRRSGLAAAGVALAVGALMTLPPLVTGHATIKQPATKPSTAAPAGPCTVTALPVPEGMTGVEPTAVDPTGRFIVGNGTEKQDFRPILWTDGKAQALPMVAESVQVTAVNASGVVVGIAANLPDMYVFRYENGRYTKLKTPPGKWDPSPAPAVNAAGDVVINVMPRGNIEGKGRISLLWKAGSTTATRLPVPANAGIHDITDDGTVIGTVYDNGVGVAGYAWDQRGTGRKLATPPGRTTSAVAAEGEWVTGGQWPDFLPTLWNLRTGKQVEVGATAVTPGKNAKNGRGPGIAVNASGVVVAGGAVYRDGREVKLGTSGGERARATAVADNGLVVGLSLDENGENAGPGTWRC